MNRCSAVMALACAGLFACSDGGTDQAASSERVSDEAPREAEVVEEAKTETSSGTEAPKQSNDAKATAPALRPAPEQAAAIAKKVFEQGLAASKREVLDEVHIKYEVYAKPEVMKGLGIEDRLAKKLGPGFFWADTSSDSAEDLRLLYERYAGKKIEFVKLEYGTHEDNEFLEIWGDNVVTIKVEDGEPQQVGELGEIVRDKATGKYWLLRYQYRKLSEGGGEPPAPPAAKKSSPAAG